MSRTYDIILSCGCMISLDGGGGTIPCLKEKGCKYTEEYLESPNYDKWEKEIKRRN